MSNRRRAALAVLCIAQFVDVMGVAVAVVALPTIRADLGASPAQLRLVVSGYALLFGCLLLPAGYAADRWGRLRLFRGGLAGFGAASLVCALAPTAPVLVAGRALQGAAAAAIVPAALALVTTIFTADAERRRALGVWTAAGAGGGAFGFVAGGVVTDLVGWRWIFAVNVPATLFSMLLARRVLPPDEAPRARQVRQVREPRRSRVLVPRGLRTLPLVVSCAVAFVNTAVTSSTGNLVTLHVQDVEGIGPAGAGLLLLPFSLAVVAGSALGAPLLGILGPRAAGAGLTTIGCGVALCAVATISSGTAAVALLAAGTIVAGTGLGCSAVASTATGTGAVPGEHLGTASGLMNTATQLGTAVGTAVLLGLSDAVAAARHAEGPGHRVALTAAAALAFVAAVAVAVVPSRRMVGTRQEVGADLLGAPD
jgi:MFS family permease